jgi:hypothetical protein
MSLCIHHFLYSSHPPARNARISIHNAFSLPIAMAAAPAIAPIRTRCRSVQHETGSVDAVRG